MNSKVLVQFSFFFYDVHGTLCRWGSNIHKHAHNRYLYIIIIHIIHVCACIVRIDGSMIGKCGIYDQTTLLWCLDASIQKEKKWTETERVWEKEHWSKNNKEKKTRTRARIQHERPLDRYGKKIYTYVHNTYMYVHCRFFFCSNRIIIFSPSNLFCRTHSYRNLTHIKVYYMRYKFFFFDSQQYFSLSFVLCDYNKFLNIKSTLKSDKNKFGLWHECE